MPFYLFAKKGDFSSPSDFSPWFTGPLITPSPRVVPLGHQNWEPTFYWNSIDGRFNEHWHKEQRIPLHQLLSQVSMKFGLFNRVDLNFVPNILSLHCEGRERLLVGDLPASLGIQILESSGWYPAIKLRIGANIPLGKYDSGKSDRYGTNFSGIGSWDPNVGLILGRLFHCGEAHYLSWRMWVNYSIPNTVSVDGLSVYGGEAPTSSLPGTKGKVHIGERWTFAQSVEFNITQNWATAIDFVYRYANRNRFSGESPPGTAPSAPSSERFDITPAIEYNFSSSVGIIGGYSLTFAGRNANVLSSWIIAINIYR